MTELLSELKKACQGVPAASDDETIARGGSTRFRGLPAHAEEGTVALAMGRDVRVVINERDVRAVIKDRDAYDVEVSSEANVLLRLEKTVKSTVQPGCRCREDRRREERSRSGEPIGGLEMGPITVCDLLCADVVVDNGRQSVLVEICIPVNCRIV